MKGVSNEATNTDKMQAHQMKVKPSDALRHEELNTRVDVDLMVCTDLVDQAQTCVLNGSLSHASVLEVLNANPEDKALSSDADPQMLIKVVVPILGLESLRSEGSDTSDTLEGEVVYRMGGQFWPTRCHARLTGELLLIQRSGKQEAAVTLHGASVELRAQSTLLLDLELEPSNSLLLVREQLVQKTHIKEPFSLILEGQPLRGRESLEANGLKAGSVVEVIQQGIPGWTCICHGDEERGKPEMAVESLPDSYPIQDLRRGVYCCAG
eukprot:g31367.t1